MFFSITAMSPPRSLKLAVTPVSSQQWFSDTTSALYGDTQGKDDVVDALLQHPCFSRLCWLQGRVQTHHIAHPTVCRSLFVARNVL